MASRQGPDTLAAFGAAVRAVRIERGVSQERLAELAGVHRTYVGSVERGERNVSLINIARIAHGLDMSAAELLQRTESTPQR